MISLQNVLALGAFFTISTILYAVCLAVYNVSFHPFRKIPGPRFNAVSRIPWIRDWLGGNLHRVVHRMHEKYGDVVRVAPDELSFIDTQAWSDIYGMRTGHTLIRDRKWYANLTENQDDIIVSDEATHARFRKIFSPPFADKSLRDNEFIIKKNIDLLLDRLSKHASTIEKPVDMVKWYNWTTFDVIGDLVYGESFGCLENAAHHPWLGVVLENIRLSSYGALMERYPLLKSIAAAVVPKHIMEKRNMHVGIIRDKVLRWSAEKPSTPKAVLQHLKDTNANISPGEIEANLGIMTMAGSETSATTMSAASYYLTTNDEAFETLKKEIRTTFLDESEITWDAVKKLPYLTAVMKEALRLYPPTPVGLPRRVMADHTTVCGHVIPKNTVVYVTQYSANRSTRNFLEPDAFRPERWLDDPKYASDNREVVQPFITGPYSCIGKSLAYMEVGLVLARMVWRFDWTLDDPEKATFEGEQVYALWQKSPLNLRLSLRSKA